MINLPVLDELSALAAEVPPELHRVAKLERIARRAADLSGAEHAAITVWDSVGRFSVLAWSSRRAAEIEPLQFRYREGPAISPDGSGLTRSDDVATDPRWPIFGPTLTERTGVLSLLSARFVTLGGGFGAVNLYSSAPAAFAATKPETMRALATFAAIVIDDELPPIGTEPNPAPDLGQAMDIVMRNEGLDRGQALGLLRASSQQLLLSISALVQLVVQFGGLPG